MSRTRKRKKEIIEELKSLLKEQKGMLFLNISGLKSDELNIVRKEFRKTDSILKVTKKTLFGIALRELGFSFDPRELEGEIATLFAKEDLISSAKTAKNLSEKFEALKLVGGYFEERMISPEEVEFLAKLPPREMLLGQLVGSFQSLISNFVFTLQSPMKGLLFVLSNWKK